ncbi:hypothetical protein FJT64_000554 [Amphibalanus amphitrite]|uniref:CCHC-type domain-containing protein n=1 Tax=Amphibalanus amphitrite TaxID=1232801 RepID=A0A6A4VVL8_AMPAM|nr:hypothetical protein FJT64_000554 [Amphibalanus amphitrite]
MDCLRAPAPFLVTPGRPTTPWSQWLGEFRIFAVASGWDEWTVQRREALLLHCVGQEARRLYFAAAKPAQGVAPGAQEAAIPAQEEAGVKEEGQPTAAVDPVAAISAVFQRLFPETRATHSERMLFRRCYQLDRSPAVYLTELQDLSSRCAFGDLQEQLTCEQFIEGCRDDRLRERLCREPALTVSRILEVAEELEVAAERQRLVGGGGATRASTSSPAQLEIAAVTTAPRKGVSPCCNCGGPHRTADPCCPARWRRCHNCQQKGHYARFCKEPPKKTKQTKRKPVRTVEVLAVTDDDRKNLWTELRVDQQPLRMLADTGSAVSILPLSVYRKQFRHLPLLPTAVRLEAYGGSSLLVQGVVQVTVQAENGNSSQVSLYVVDAGVPLLGRDLQEKLKLSVIHGATVCAIKEEQMPEELPSLTGFVHSVKLKTEVNPVQQRLRPLPSTPHATTGLSPAELLHGRKLRTRLHAAALPTEEPQDRELRDRVQKRQKKQKRYADERRAAETPRFQVGDWVRCRLVPRPKKGRPRYSEPRRVESRLGPVSYRLDDGSRIHAERLTTARAPQQSQAELHVDQSGQPGAGQRSAVSPTSVPRRGERMEADDWRHAEDGVPLEDGQAVSLGVGRRHTEASRGPAEDGVAVSPEDAEDAREREASPPPATERQAEQQDAGVLLSPREAASGAGLEAVEPALQPGARVNSGTQPLHSNELVLREVFQNLDGKTSGPGSFTGPLGKAAGGSVHRLSPVKFRPVSGPELDLPDNIIADLSSDKLLLYQLTRAVRTGNISAKEACKKIGPLNHARHHNKVQTKF